jgi:hypothetical protein
MCVPPLAFAALLALEDHLLYHVPHPRQAALPLELLRALVFFATNATAATTAAAAVDHRGEGGATAVLTHFSLSLPRRNNGYYDDYGFADDEALLLGRAPAGIALDAGVAVALGSVGKEEYSRPAAAVFVVVVWRLVILEARRHVVAAGRYRGIVLRHTGC